MGIVFKDDVRDAEHVLGKVVRMLGENGERWVQRSFSLDENGAEVRPFNDVSCKWCLTGAVYGAIGDEDLFWENWVEGDKRQLEEEGNLFPGNPLLASCFCDALQEMHDRKGVLSEKLKQDLILAEDLEESLQVFNDNVCWEDMKAFLHYAGLALGLKKDHINHWRGA